MYRTKKLTGTENQITIKTETTIRIKIGNQTLTESRTIDPTTIKTVGTKTEEEEKM